MTLERLRELGLEAAQRADAMGCGWSTQGGGMPEPAELDAMLERALGAVRRSPPGGRGAALRALVTTALFAALLDEPVPAQEQP